MATQRKTAQEIIEANQKIIADNNLKSWNEIHKYVLEQRLNSKAVA